MSGRLGKKIRFKGFQTKISQRYLGAEEVERGSEPKPIGDREDFSLGRPKSSTKY